MERNEQDEEYDRGRLSQTGGMEDDLFAADENETCKTENVCIDESSQEIPLDEPSGHFPDSVVRVRPGVRAVWEAAVMYARELKTADQSERSGHDRVDSNAIASIRQRLATESTKPGGKAKSSGDRAVIARKRKRRREKPVEGKRKALQIKRVEELKPMSYPAHSRASSSFSKFSSALSMGANKKRKAEDMNSSVKGQRIPPKPLKATEVTAQGSNSRCLKDVERLSHDELSLNQRHLFGQPSSSVPKESPSTRSVPAEEQDPTFVPKEEQPLTNIFDNEYEDLLEEEMFDEHEKQKCS